MKTMKGFMEMRNNFEFNAPVKKESWTDKCLRKAQKYLDVTNKKDLLIVCLLAVTALIMWPFLPVN